MTTNARPPLMLPCPEIARFLQLWDNFLDAECALYQFGWRPDVLFDGHGTEGMLDHVKDGLTDQEEYNTLLTVASDARAALAVEAAHGGAEPMQVLLAINLSLAVWDCVDTGEIWLCEDGCGMEGAEAWSVCLINAWKDSVWLAKLQDDARFSAKLIEKFHSAPVCRRH